MKFDKMSSGVPMYKCRENSKLFHFSKDEMFHIPYEKRNLVGNQRFSLSGLPCLYLGGSSYIIVVLCATVPDAQLRHCLAFQEF